jgi:hypothetical protein
MKLFTAFLLLLSANSYATLPLPDCWASNGKPVGTNASGQRISDGEWLISVNPKLLSKDELLWLLDTTNSHSLYPTMTIVRPEYILLGAKAVDDGSHSPNLSPREEIQRKANAQMSAVAALAATDGLGCNEISGPGSPITFGIWLNQGVWTLPTSSPLPAPIRHFLLKNWFLRKREIKPSAWVI